MSAIPVDEGPDGPGAPVVEVRGLRLGVGDRTVVDGVDLRIGDGQRWGLIGASGAGKSLTASTMAGLAPAGIDVRGHVRVAGHDLTDAAARSAVRGRGVALVAQDSATALHPLVRVGDQVALPLRTLHSYRAARAATAAIDLLARVGLPDPRQVARSRPAQLSGGQRQRVALAAALACGARLLVADEPTAALDPTVAAALLAELDTTLRADGTALLMVTHDLASLSTVCDRLAVLAGGRIVEQGTVAEVVASPRHEATRALIDAARSLAPATARTGP